MNEAAVRRLLVRTVLWMGLGAALAAVAGGLTGDMVHADLVVGEGEAISRQQAILGTVAGAVPGVVGWTLLQLALVHFLASAAFTTLRARQRQAELEQIAAAPDEESAAILRWAWRRKYLTRDAPPQATKPLPAWVQGLFDAMGV